MLLKVIIRLTVNAVALWVTDYILEGIWFKDTEALIVTAIIFGLLNTFIRPILFLLTLPINLLTLGLFTLIINAIILELAAWLVDSFVISSFLTAIVASIFISLVSIFLNSLLYDKRYQ